MTMHFAVVLLCLFSIFLFPIMPSSSSTQQQETDDMIQTIKKTIYLIRHAESEENRRLAALSRCGGSIGKFQLPSFDDFQAGSGFLLNIMGQVDSDLSEAGKAQIKTIATKLQQDNFVETAGVQLIAHSPLQRAKQTCKGMLGCDSDDKECDIYSSVNRVVELPLLTEKTPAEWIPGNSKSLSTRIQNLEHWLIQQPESTILLVGHSQLFKAMLGLSFKLGNCDVWQATLEGAKDDATTPAVVLEATDTTPKAVDNAQYVLPRGWRDLKRLYVGATATKVGECAQQEELPN